MIGQKTIPRWAVVALSIAIPVGIIGGVIVYSRNPGTPGPDQQRQQLLREFRLHPTPFRQEYMTLVDLSRAQQDYETAVAVLKAAALEQPKNEFIFELLGDVYEQQGNYAAAEAAYRRAILDDASAVVAYTKLADLLWDHDHGNATDIEQLLNEGAKVTGHPNILKRLARYYTDTVHTARAIETWTAVLKLEPDNAAVKEEIAALKKQL